MSEIRLLPCPFCGGGPEVIEVTEDDGFENRGGSAIECQGCHASSHVEFGRKENLISSWNRRAALSSAAVAERQDALFNRVLSDPLVRSVVARPAPTQFAEREPDSDRSFLLRNAVTRVSELEAENARLREEVARYWTSADLKPWCDLAEEKGLSHFGKKLKGMFNRAIAAEDSARVEFDRAEAAEARVAELEKALEPFADIAGKVWADENGWTDDACQNDRICDWFGPSAFHAARRVREGGKVDD